MNRRGKAVTVLVALWVGVFVAAAAWAGEPVRITKEELKHRLGTPGISVVDVRLGTLSPETDRKIVGAVREDPSEVDSWAKRYAKDKPIVLYCS